MPMFVRHLFNVSRLLNYRTDGSPKDERFERRLESLQCGDPRDLKMPRLFRS